MAKIESKTGKIDNNPEPVYNYLTDFNNFEQLIPADKVSNWRAEGGQCSFDVDGVGEIKLEIIERKAHELIKLEGVAQGMVHFTFWIQLKAIEEKDTRVKISVEPGINPMMMAMVKKPLKNFVDLLVEKMEEMEFH